MHPDNSSGARLVRRDAAAGLGRRRLERRRAALQRRAGLAQLNHLGQRRRCALLQHPGLCKRAGGSRTASEERIRRNDGCLGWRGCAAPRVAPSPAHTMQYARWPKAVYKRRTRARAARSATAHPRVRVVQRLRVRLQRAGVRGQRLGRLSGRRLERRHPRQQLPSSGLLLGFERARALRRGRDARVRRA